MANVFRQLFISADAGTLEGDPLVQEAVERLQGAAHQLSAITIRTLSETAPDDTRALLQQQIGEASALIRTLRQVFSSNLTVVNLADGLTAISQLERLLGAVQVANLDRMDMDWKESVMQRLQAAHKVLSDNLPGI